METYVMLRWLRRWLLALLILPLAVHAVPAVTPHDTDSVRLDSLKRLAVFYEDQGDYEQAYGYGVTYTTLRERIQQQTLNKLVDDYEEEFANNALENERVNLMKQRALMELDQVEKELATTRLRRTQDSITLLNQHLDRQNRISAAELATKQLKQKEELQRLQNEQKRSRFLVLLTLNGVILVLLVLAVIYLRSTLRHSRMLEAERRRAVATMERAQADNETQNRFLLNLNMEIRQPVDDILREARKVSAEGTSCEDDAVSVERMRPQIHNLLDQVNNILQKCSDSSEEMLMTVMLVVMLAVGCLRPTPVRAQNDNPYGIRQDLYEYFRKADLLVQKECVLEMSDTLLMRARVAGDGLAMCLAYDLRVGHAYFSRNVDLIRAEHEKQKACALATGFHNYVFYGWNRVILTYLNHRQFVEAGLEVQRYQTEAMELNNEYGISRGYYYMGDIFKSRGMLVEATEQYQMAVDYLLAHNGQQEIASAYASLGEALVEQRNYVKGERCLKAGLRYARLEYERIRPNQGLLDLYITLQQVDEASVCITELERLKSMGMLMGGRYTNFMNSMVKYYLLVGDKKRAIAYLDSLGNTHPRTKYQAYAAVGEYKKALNYLYAYNRAAAADDATMDAARLAALKADYDNHMKERANDELALHNALLRTEQLKAEQILGTEQNRQDSLLISNSSLLEDAQQKALNLQQADEQAAFERMQHEEKELGYQRFTMAILLLLLLGVSIFVILKLVERRWNAVRWQRQKQEAEEATRLAVLAGERKVDFLQQVTHELRTPLNAVLGFSEVLADETMRQACSEEELADFRVRIADGANSLESLVASTLELCALEGGEVKAKKEKVVLPELFGKLQGEYSAKLHEGVSLTAEADKVTVETDSNLLHQALCLLLDNACKFTTQGNVTLSCQRNQRTVEISVADTGCGIPAEKAEDIFKHFEKVDSFIPGIGLGLCLCRAIVTLLNGEVYLDTAYKGGSRFVIGIIE